MRKRRNGRSVAEPVGSARVFAALGDENRLRLVRRLCNEGPASITQLTAGARITRQAVTKHLRVMQSSALVRSRRRGRERIWELKQRRIGEVRKYLEMISKQWDEALGRLKELVEK